MTLLEVTVVMLIVALLAAVAAPKFSDTMRASQVRAAAIKIASDIDYVRQVAINEGRSTEIYFDESDDRYFCTDIDVADRIGKLLNVPLKDVFDPSLELSAEIDNEKAILFDIEGTPRNSTSAMVSGVITVSSANVPSYYVIIAAGTGFTSIVVEDTVDGNTGATEETADADPETSGLPETPETGPSPAEVEGGMAI